MGKLIALSGMTGVGKTSLVKYIDEMLGGHGFGTCEVVTEPLKDNHIFKIINEDSKYMYANQIEFLIRFLDSYKENSLLEKPIVRDRCIEEVMLFTELNAMLGSIGSSELYDFKVLYDRLTKDVKKPDVVILLDGKEAEVLNRIKSRGRGEEEAISHYYLSCLRTAYLEKLPKLLPNTEIIKMDWGDSEPKNVRYKQIIEKLIDIL